MKRILLVDLAERELKERTQLRNPKAETPPSESASAGADEKPARKRNTAAAKSQPKQAIDPAFTRRLRF